MSDSAAPAVDAAASEQHGQDEMKNNKRKRDEDAEYDSTAEDLKEEDDEPPYYVNWRLITPEVMEKCFTYSDKIAYPRLCSIVWLNFNYDKFREIYPEHPEIYNASKRKLFFSTSWLKFIFGYSPTIANDGKVANNLRVTLSDFIDQEGPEFYAWLKTLDDFFKRKAQEMNAKWKVSNLSYEPVCRDPQNQEPGKYPQYASFKFNTQRKETVQNANGSTTVIPEDRYTAKVLVWQKTTDGPKLIAEKLTRENAVPEADELKADPTVKDSRKIILDKNYHGKLILQLPKIYISQKYGITLNIEEIMYDTEENLRSAQKARKRVCPFKE
jgi:hypothetical protein